MDTAEWLRGLGLAQYEPAFRDNAIDGEILPELTADDLRDLGVNLVGHRRRLLAAIAALRAEAKPEPRTTEAALRPNFPEPAGGSQPPVDPPAGDPDPSLPRSRKRVKEGAAAGAERRQVTVMFCDMVGSTPLSARHDPEDLRGIIGAYHRCVADIVDGFGGFVARYMGDGVLIYFGYPQAHEDDAERSIRCALALVARVSRLNLAEDLHSGSGPLQAWSSSAVRLSSMMSSARPRTSPPGCRRSPSPTLSSSRRAPAAWSAIFSNIANLARSS